MKVDRSLQRLDTDEPESLAHAARDVGAELSRRRLETLGQFRAALASLQIDRDAGAKSFGAGYRAAILDVLAAFDAAVRPQNRLEEALAVVRGRKQFTKIVLLLKTSPALPREIARKLRLDSGSVSRALSTLRELAVIEFAVLSEGADARTRPHRLTLFGENVAARCDDEISRISDFRPMVKGVVFVCTQLAMDQRMPESRLRAIVRHSLGTSATSVSKLLGETLKESAFAQDLSGMWVATPAASQDSLRLSLELVLKDLSSPSRVQPSWIQHIFSASTRCSALYVRCTSTAQTLWDQILVKADGRLPTQRRTISSPDLDIGDIPQPEQGSALLVYDSSSTLRSDLENFPAMREFVESTQNRMCIAGKDESIPPEFDRVSLENVA